MTFNTDQWIFENGEELAALNRLDCMRRISAAAQLAMRERCHEVTWGNSCSEECDTGELIRREINKLQPE